MIVKIIKKWNRARLEARRAGAKPYAVGMLSRMSRSGRYQLIVDYVNARFSSADKVKLRSPYYVPRTLSRFDAESCQIKAIAFYLPQFHSVPENDAWWGLGFTEWTNVTKAQPQFIGHHQPRLPGELGFYDLSIPDVLRKQADLAKLYGISGFCFHYYWFDGRRLLEKPINNFLNDKSIDIEFCFCWANENWTRRWDGADQEVLMQQKYSDKGDIEFIDELSSAFSDPRYIKIDGRPVLVVYRVTQLPDAKATAQRWRARVREHGFPDIYLVAARSLDNVNPKDFGFDAAVEFPPHQAHAPNVARDLPVINPGFRGGIYRYEDMASKLGSVRANGFRLFKAVAPSWDNEARKPGRGDIFFGSTPALYSQWLKNAAEITMMNPQNERLLFINAWNEWGEGAHLEPDLHMGYAYLHATASTLELFSKSDVDVQIQAINDAFVKRSEVAIVLHLFYEDVFDDLLNNYIRPLIGRADLFVSVRPSVQRSTIQKIGELAGHVYITKAQNVGRDVMPFLLTYPDLLRRGYQYACKLHTKKSPQLTNGDDLRRALFDDLVGSEDVFLRNISLLKNGDVSLVCPAGALLSQTYKDMDPRTRLHIAKTFSALGAHGYRLPNRFTFPAGTMFFFNVDSLRIIADRLVFPLSDFESELGQVDGTFAHAVERMIGVIAQQAKKGILTVGQEKNLVFSEPKKSTKE